MESIKTEEELNKFLTQSDNEFIQLQNRINKLRNELNNPPPVQKKN